jgi:hypothetical protein
VNKKRFFRCGEDVKNNIILEGGLNMQLIERVLVILERKEARL